MRVLAIGDVTAGGLAYLKSRLPRLKREREIDFCVVNGENASLVGMTPQQAEDILNAGADVITMGNHTWNRRELIPYIEDSRIFPIRSYASLICFNFSLAASCARGSPA